MPNDISKKIHLFWAGSSIPDYIVENIKLFLRYLLDGWCVFLWVTSPNLFSRDEYLDQFKPYSRILVIKDIEELLDSDIFEHLAQKYPIDNLVHPFKVVRSIIDRELIGLGNPAVAKDACVPLILYKEGGYYFDLDAKPTKPIIPPTDAPYGILLLNKGRIVAALATEKKHIFCVYALSYLVRFYRKLPETALSYFTGEGKRVAKIGLTHYHPNFFNSEILRIRTEKYKNRRVELTCRTSGSILVSAYELYASKLFGEKVDPMFHSVASFPILSDRAIAMGIEFNLVSDGQWRELKKFDSFDSDSIPSMRSWDLNRMIRFTGKDVVKIDSRRDDGIRSTLSQKKAQTEITRFRLFCFSQRSEDCSIQVSRAKATAKTQKALERAKKYC